MWITQYLGELKILYKAKKAAYLNHSTSVVGLRGFIRGQALSKISIRKDDFDRLV